MNITFTIMAHGFEKAAQIEKALIDIGAPFTAVVAKPVNAPRRKRAVVDKATLAAVVTTIDKHPDWSDKEIARVIGLGHNTVNRIRHGNHFLQSKEVKNEN